MFLSKRCQNQEPTFAYEYYILCTMQHTRSKSLLIIAVHNKESYHWVHQKRFCIICNSCGSFIAVLYTKHIRRYLPTQQTMLWFRRKEEGNRNHKLKLKFKWAKLEEFAQMENPYGKVEMKQNRERERKERNEKGALGGKRNSKSRIGNVAALRNKQQWCLVMRSKTKGKVVIWFRTQDLTN